MGGTCRFCDIISGKITGEENLPIWENDTYISLASIGAIIEGWILVIPKKHVISMKELYSTKDFNCFINDMLDLMKLNYSGPFIAFEHGANKCGSDTSCGTSHAHIHLLAYKDSLYRDMISTGLKWEKSNVNQIVSRVGSNEYLFYSEISSNSSWKNPEGYLHILEQPISQYFRRLIASQINRASEYDYKKYPYVDVAIGTNRTLSMSLARRRG